MCPRYVDRLTWLRGSLALLLVALLCGLAACSSSPSKSHNAEKNPKQEEAPAGPPPPPPIPPEATQEFEKALTLLSAGDYTQAATQLQQLSKAYPDYSGPLVNLGIVYLKTDKLDLAEKTLKDATQRGAPSAAAYNQLGIVYRKLGRFKEADDAYSSALRIDPNYALAHLNLAVLCDMYLQQPQRALDEYDAYLNLVPNPDKRVEGWAKELETRLQIKSRRHKSQTGGQPAAQPPAAPPADAQKSEQPTVQTAPAAKQAGS